MVLEMLTGGGLLAIGWLIGRFAPSRRRSPKPPKPVCGCGHEMAFHDQATGMCHGTREVATRYNSYGEETAWKPVQCTCKQYVGPTPLSTIYAPEVTG